MTPAPASRPHDPGPALSPAAPARRSTARSAAPARRGIAGPVAHALRGTARPGAPVRRGLGRSAAPAPARVTRPVASLGAIALLVALAVAGLASTGSAGPPDPPATTAGTYRLPLPGPPQVARAFEAPPQPWAVGHRGVDLRTTPGAPVLSPVAGVVSFAGTVAGRGVVTVTDARGRRSSIEPVLAAVRAGDAVEGGEPLGLVTPEGSHCAPGTCLHWGVRVGDEYVDPFTLLPGAGPAVLLPLDARRVDGTAGPRGSQ